MGQSPLKPRMACIDKSNSHSQNVRVFLKPLRELPSIRVILSVSPFLCSLWPQERIHIASFAMRLTGTRGKVLVFFETGMVHPVHLSVRQTRYNFRIHEAV